MSQEEELNNVRQEVNMWKWMWHYQVHYSQDINGFWFWDTGGVITGKYPTLLQAYQSIPMP